MSTLSTGDYVSYLLFKFVGVGCLMLEGSMLWLTWASCLPVLEDTVVALSVTGILKVWIVTSETGGMQVRWTVISFLLYNLNF